jgi:hypothetical protein
MSTSPYKPPTHWHQTVLPILSDIEYKAGSKLAGEIECAPMLTDHRGLRITVEITAEDSMIIGPFEYLIY